MFLSHARLSAAALRRSRLSIAMAALVAVGACGGSGRDVPEAERAASASAAPQDPTAPPPRPKLVALGDSLTAGYGLLDSQSYPAVLQQRLDAEGYEFEVVNAGVSGDTTAGGLRRLDWALQGDVRVLIVALGGNDGLRGLSVSEMKQNLTAIVEGAKARGVTVILAGMEAPPNYGQEYAQAFRLGFREVALKQRIIFIPFLLQNVAGHAELNQADGIHPNPQGAIKVADTVWSVLRPMLDQMTGAS